MRAIWYVLVYDIYTEIDVLSITFSFFLGTIGFFACFWFVTKIYSVVKVDWRNQCKELIWRRFSLHQPNLKSWSWPWTWALSEVLASCSLRVIQNMQLPQPPFSTNTFVLWLNNLITCRSGWRSELRYLCVCKYNCKRMLHSNCRVEAAALHYFMILLIQVQL